MSDLEHFTEYQIHLFIDRIVLPILLALGTAGNIIIVTVLTKPTNRNHSMARLLTALALSDGMALWLAVPNNWLISMYGIYIRDTSEILCKGHTYIALVSFQLSTSFIAAISVERFICIILPLKAKTLCSMRNTNRAIAAIVGWNILLSGHLFYGMAILDTGKCGPKESVYKELLWNIWRVTHLISAVVFPFIIILVANISITIKLTGAKCTRKTSRLTTSALSQMSSKITMILMLVVITFFVCIIPGGIFFFNYYGEQWGHGKSHQDAVVLLFWSVSVVLGSTNSAINFLLYFLSGSKFREEVKNLCGMSSTS